MSTASRVWLSLAAFLVTAGTVYGFTSHELAGAPLLIVCAAAFCYLGIVARRAARRSSGDGGEPETGSEEAVHVAPTIWPFGFSIAGVVLVVGFIVSPWLLALGVILFSVSAGGWLREVARGHHQPEGS